MNNILLIEDSKSYSKTLTILLSQLKYQITQAYTLNEAKEYLKTETFDYLLLDLLLPDGEGDEVLDEIINTKKDSKIIVLSGEKDIQKRNYLFENGVIDYYSKQTPLKALIFDIDKTLKDLTRNKNKNILVVEDSSFVRKTMNIILSSKNYNTFLAKDVTDALEILKTQNIDLIYSDLEMPNIDGTEFLDIIKKDILLKDIPVLILSGNQDRENYARVLKHGAIDFIKKPFLTEEILLKTDLHIQHFDQTKEIAKKAKELNEYKRILNESDIVSKTDAKGRITYVNQKFIEITGYKEDELIGKAHNIVRHPDVDKSIYKDMWRHLKEKKTYKSIIKNRKKDGTAYYVDATISPILDTRGNIQEIIGLRHDITDIMNPKKQLMDDLFYMKNPVLIFLQIVNYDLFKEFYSETIMHRFENEFEKKVLEYFPKYSQIKKVYNLNNGLFAFLKNEEIEPNYINMCLSEVIKNFQEKGIDFLDNNYDIEVCLSFSKDKSHIYDDVYLGINHAIKNNISILHAENFHRRTQIEARKKLKSVQMIKEALQNNESHFISLFQGIVDNETKEIVKYESLVRLEKKDKKLLSPFHFLELSKKTGYYNQITKTVIDNSFKAVELTNKNISINLSASDIENIDIRSKLLELVMRKEYKGKITFELLEDEHIKDFEIIKDFISLCKISGNVKISIDDFGSGYSNFERLLDFQPDFLKIDASLIKNIVENSYSRHVVEAIIVFAKKENIKTIAEFVETEEIYEMVKKLGIDYSQGYFFHKPSKLN